MERNLALIVLIFVSNPNLTIYFRRKCISRRFVRCATVLKKTRVMVILNSINLIIEAESHFRADLVIGLVRTISALTTTLKKMCLSHRVFITDFFNITGDSIGITVNILFLGLIIGQYKGHTAIHNGLTL